MRSSRFALWRLLECLIFVENCDEKESVPTSGAVGHVVVVKGDVSAQRAGKAMRKVQADDTVFADDTVVTGEASSIEILLKHNGALWELGESSERRIDKGTAFHATTKGAAPLDKKEALATAAAGRGTTREAGESVGTVLDGEDGADGSEDDETAPAAPVKKKREVRRPADTGPRRKSPVRRSPVRAPHAPAPPPLPSSPRARPIVVAPASPAPMAPRRDTEAPNTGDDDDGAIDEVAPAPARHAPVQGVNTRDRGHSSDAQQRSHITTLARRCHVKHGGSGTLKFKVSAAGLFSASSNEASLGPVVSCLRKAMLAGKLPNSSAISSSLKFP
ncbi:MAG: hypothetical protein GY811_15270 [Myxococcales bacterium]|nr:hypothetical protein [Myxococcales bacterium]